MENVSTTRNLSHFSTISESIHTYDTLNSVELVDFFVVLSKVYDRDQLLVSLNECLVYDSSKCFSLVPLPLTTGIFHHLLCLLLSKLSYSLVSGTVLSIDICINPLKIIIIHTSIMDALPLDFTSKSEKHEATRRAKTAEKYHD